MRRRLDARGSTTMEMALLLPAFLALVMTFFNAGRVFVWQSGIQNGLGDAARAATLFPRRTDSQLIAVFRNGVYGVPESRVPAPVITAGTANNNDYVDISVTYNPSVTFGFFDISTVSVTETRRAWRTPT